MSTPEAVLEPVNSNSHDAGSKIEEGMALCLSGGGYRAMVFHLGVLIRLEEIGVLGKLKRISSVSGGSITAALLGLRWKDLGFQNGSSSKEKLNEKVIQPIRSLASKTIDEQAVFGGVLSPFSSVADKIANSYKKHLYGDATLQDLPNDAAGEGPRFVINATSLQSGVLWRFSRPYMGDYRIGRIKDPKTSLAVAVGASSAFPPVLSPVTLDLDPTQFIPDEKSDLHRPPYTHKAVLADGGVYDNLGLETIWKRYKTILVSDAGGKTQPDPHPKGDWGSQALRVNDLIDNQVRSLRKIQLIEAYKKKTVHDGAYWGIRTEVANYPKPGTLACPPAKTLELANISTRLDALDESVQNRLINWGYAVCAAAMESHVLQPAVPAAKFPCPDGV